MPQSAVCKKTIQVPEELAGKLIKCGKCGRPHWVPLPSQPAEVARVWDELLSEGGNRPPRVEDADSSSTAGEQAVPRENKCPECASTLPSGVVVCFHCGYDFRTGKKRKPRKTSHAGSAIQFFLRANFFGMPGPIFLVVVILAGWVVAGLWSFKSQKLVSIIDAFEELEPRMTLAEVAKLLGEPSKREAPNNMMIQLLADPGNKCEVTSPPGFGKPGTGLGAGGTAWTYGPYPGNINGKKTTAGGTVIGLRFADGKLVEAVKLTVGSSLSDSTR